MKKAALALADGTVFEGSSFGADGESIGEVIFNTSMVGYQEILTDPSYCGQIVTMTYPLIGNYGTNAEDLEATTPFLSGFVVKEYAEHPSNWRSTKSLQEFLKEHSIVAIQGIDTRALTKHIRDAGAQQGIISTVDFDHDRLVKKAQGAPGLTGRDLVKDVTTRAAYNCEEGEKTHKDVVVYDFGVKQNILRMLRAVGCRVHVVPAATSAEAVVAIKPDGILLSNGPGDPEAVSYAIEAIKKLLGKRPIFGICLGHQLLALALGGKTYKLKFGHHGANHPVMEKATGKVEITTQNHGFAVDPDSLAKTAGFGKVDITHTSLYDHSVEGLRCVDLPAFSVQYHPEASPGPHDARYLFHRFLDMMGR